MKRREDLLSDGGYVMEEAYKTFL